MNPLEIEVKFFLNNKETIYQRIKQLSAVSLGREFESNTCYDDSARKLYSNKSLLRLRQNKKNILTLKLKPSENSTDFKIMQELEVEVSDYTCMSKILQALDFKEQLIYEKWRETFKWRDAIICLDTMPFGEFMELEGPGPTIIELSGKLGLQWEKRILLNYLSIFSAIKKKFKLSFSDITFNNFSSISLDFTHFLNQFEAGSKQNCQI